MKLRLSQLPIYNVTPNISFLHPKYWKNINFADTTREKYSEEKIIKIYINSHNNSNEIKPVTTKDIKVYIDDEQVEMYDPNTPILIIFLRPNDTFKCMMTSSLAVGEMHTTYCACSNAWDTYENENKDNGETIFKEGQLFMKTRGNQSEYSILYKACDYLIKKFNDIKIEIDRKVKSKEIDSTLNDLILVLDDEDHTIGEIINYELQDLALFSAVSKPDHNIKSVTLKIETDTKKKPCELIEEVCDILTEKIKKIQSLIKKN
jgi:DNA-directed RNA polymerase subunit L